MAQKNDKHKSAEPMYSLGEKLCELGEALKDNRTRIEELAGLAHEAGLHLSLGIVPAGGEQ